MKKVYFVIFALIISILVLASCNAPEQNPENTDKNDAADGVTPSPAPDSESESTHCTYSNPSGHTHSYLKADGTYRCECGADYFAETLEFALNKSGNGYIVTGMGKCERGNVVVPAEYQGKPVIGIGAGAFKLFKGTINHKSALIESFYLPEGILFIGYGAFTDSSIKEINLPSTLKYIELSAFNNTPIKDIDIPEHIQRDKNTSAEYEPVISDKIDTDPGHKYVYSEADGTYRCECGADYFSDTLDFMINEDGATCTVAGIGSCTKRDIVIPTEHNGMRVTKIGKMAFFNCKTVDTVIIPEGVTEIGNEAFCDSSLKAVSLPESLSRIGGYAFSSCLLEAVTVPHADIICESAFESSINLREIILCEGVKTVENCAFNCLYSLEKIVFPNTLELSEDCDFLLGEPTFYDLLNYPDEWGGSEQSEFTVYNDVIYIGNETNPYLAAHSTTKYIEDIVLHPDTKIITPEIYYGIYGDYGLREPISSITIPKGVRQIGATGWFFQRAESIYYEGTADEWYTLVGDAKTYDAKIYFYLETAPTAEGNYWHYGEDGKIIVWE